MNETLKKHLFDFFSGKVTEIDEAIRKTLEQSSQTTTTVVRHYFSGGSYKSAQFLFVSEATYHRHIRKFLRNLEKMTKLSA